MTSNPSPEQHAYLVRQAAYVQRLRNKLLKDIGPTLKYSLKELRDLVLQLDNEGIFRQMQWQQLEDLSSVPLERVARAVQGVLRETLNDVEAHGAAQGAAYVAKSPPGAVNIPVDEMLDRVVFDRSRYSLGKSLTPEKADMISRYARKMQEDYAKTVRAGLIADQPTKQIANHVANVRVIRGRDEALIKAATYANKMHSRVRNSIDGALGQTLARGQRRAWKGLVKYIWVMDPALEGKHCRICLGLSAREPQDSPSGFWKVPKWHPGCNCQILPVINKEEIATPA